MTTPSCGTWQRYASKQNPCRCLACRAAWRDYNRTRNRNIAYGRLTPQSPIDATPAREHLAQLREYGLGARAIAEAHGVSRVTLERIANGTQQQVRPTTLAKVLAIRPNPANLLDRAKVDGTGTRRRIQALVAQGWTMSALAKRMGCTPENVRQVATGRNGHHVTAGTWRAVNALYASTWDQAPPSRSSAQRGASTAARALAADRGWAPVMAWDDDSIDDPAATPYIGEQVSARYTTGRPSEHTAEDVADVLSWDSLATAAKVAERLSTSTHALLKALDRAGRDDLRDQLNRNARLAGHPVDEQIAARRRTA